MNEDRDWEEYDRDMRDVGPSEDAMQAIGLLVLFVVVIIIAVWVSP